MGLINQEKTLKKVASILNGEARQNDKIVKEFERSFPDCEFNNGLKKTKEILEKDLKGPEDFSGLDEPFKAASMYVLKKRDMVDLLFYFAINDPSKLVKKTARHALVMLKAEGKDIELPKENVTPMITAPEPVEPISISMPVSNGGSYMLFYCDREDKYTINFFTVGINHTGILAEFKLDVVENRGYRQFLKNVKKSDNIMYFQTSNDYIKYLINRAAERTKALEIPLPKVYLEFQDKFDFEGDNPNPVLKDITYEDIEKEIEELKQKTLDLKDIEGEGNIYIVQPDILVEVRKKAKELGESRLEVDTETKEEYDYNEIVKVVHNNMKKEYLEHYVDIFELMAYHLWRKDETDLAKLALAVALLVKRSEGKILEIPYFEAVFKEQWKELKNIEEAEKMNQPQESSPVINAQEKSSESE